MIPRTTQRTQAPEAYLLILHPDESLGEKVARDFAQVLGWDVYIARQRLRLRAPQILKKVKAREEAERFFIELSALGLKVTLAREGELKKIPPPLEVKGAKIGPEGLSFIPYSGSALEFPFQQNLLVVKGTLDKEILAASPKGFLRKPLVKALSRAGRRIPVDPLYCNLADVYNLSGPQGVRIWFYRFNFDFLGIRRDASPFLNFHRLLEFLHSHFTSVAEDENFKWLPKDLALRRERKIFSDIGLGTIKEQEVMDNLGQFNNYSRLRFAVSLSPKGGSEGKPLT